MDFQYGGRTMTQKLCLKCLSSYIISYQYPTEKFPFMQTILSLDYGRLMFTLFESS
jgi:hypothetical protein